MTINNILELMDKYAKCPKCGCETVGNGTGTFEVDTTQGKGYFKRTCHCGWSVKIKNDLKV